MTKYEVGGSQGLYQPGSDNKVLANKLGITEPVDIDEAELVLLEKLYRNYGSMQALVSQALQASIKPWYLLFFAFNMASIFLTGWPVFIAVELATARRIRDREVVWVIDPVFIVISPKINKLIIAILG